MENPREFPPGKNVTYVMVELQSILICEGDETKLTSTTKTRSIKVYWRRKYEFPWHFLVARKMLEGLSDRTLFNDVANENGSMGKFFKFPDSEGVSLSSINHVRGVMVVFDYVSQTIEHGMKSNRRTGYFDMP
ncbi:hypothetical protein WA026_012023 [Henosepilachna vigintioctopunctata]|uniref:Uncharacterized protein n=1 Tax=Henosepilachna vigintioctopunctata TaxID=420089 RepID=A0AAW1V4P8_9CUCU